MLISNWSVVISACVAGVCLLLLLYSKYEEKKEIGSKKLTDSFEEDFSEWFVKKLFIRDVTGYAICVKGSSGMATIDGVWRIYPTESQANECIITSGLVGANPNISLEVRAVNMTYNFK